MDGGAHNIPVLLRSRERADCTRDARATNDLKTFAATVDIPGVPRRPDDDTSGTSGRDPRFGKHHLVWLDCLQRVEDGEIKRLMGLMPPGSAKSTYTSILFPVHVMGRCESPNHQFGGTVLERLSLVNWGLHVRLSVLFQTDAGPSVKAHRHRARGRHKQCQPVNPKLTLKTAAEQA